jgi:hypothetical protein
MSSVRTVDRSAIRPSVIALGLLLALVTSGGLLGERLSVGSLRVTLAINALVTCVAILVLVLTEKHAGAHGAAGFLPLALGAALGIALVHLALRAGIVDGAPWMSERPAQFVNDAVLVAALLGVVCASLRDFQPGVLVAALFLLTAYRMTAALWHLDVAPHGFTIPVQDSVVADVVAAAFALPVYRVATNGM